MDLKHPKPRVHRVAYAVARVTFLEIIRDKVLYNILLCAGLLFGLSFLASRLSFIRQDRIVLDFGISALGISCAILAVFTGATLIGKEFDRRTIFVALSRPISRHQFVLGKFLGLSGVIFLNWLLLTAVLYGMLFQASVDGVRLATLTLVSAQLLVLFQCIMLAALTVLFSCFTTASLAVIFSIGLYAVGNNISQLRILASKLEDPFFEVLLKGGSQLIPNLEYFNLGFHVSYGLPVETGYVLGSIGYAGAVIALCLLASGLLLQKREG